MHKDPIEKEKFIIDLFPTRYKGVSTMKMNN